MTQQSPSYSITMRLRYPDQPGQLGKISSLIGQLDGQIGAIDIVKVEGTSVTRDVTVSATNVEHGERIVEKMREMPNVDVVNVSDRTFLLHLGGKIEIQSKVPAKTRDDLSLAYSPGVARVCRTIYSDPEASFALTIRRNTIAVVTDGSAVLGMGNIGPRAALPVMEGKAVLFKEFGDIDAFPICLDTQDTDEIVATVCRLAVTFGGINLEDISAPRCIEIEERLSRQLDIPVFHDDQHGTAIVVLAALQNALQVVGKDLSMIKVTISGTGAAGIAIVKLLRAVGVQHLVVCDRKGAVFAGREGDMDSSIRWIAENTNTQMVTGTLNDAIAGADVFIGVSSGSALRVEDLKRMAHDPIVFALASPDPEIDPDEAAPHVRILATGRSDYANQINNVLCFPGLFRGLLDVRASDVTQGMKLAAAKAIGSVIPPDELRADYIIPSVFDRRVAPAVAEAVSRTAIDEGVAPDNRKPRKVAFRFAKNAGSPPVRGDHDSSPRGKPALQRRNLPAVTKLTNILPFSAAADGIRLDNPQSVSHPSVVSSQRPQSLEGRKMTVDQCIWDQASQAKEVKGFLEKISSELNGYNGPERRSETRQRIVVPVLLMPFTSCGRQDGEAIHGVTRDLSDSGIGFLTTTPVHSDKVGLLFQTLSCDELMVALEVTRCRRVGHYYDIGGRFAGTIQKFSASESA